MNKRHVGLAVAAVAGLLIATAGIEQAAARSGHGGGHGSGGHSHGGGGMRGYSGGHAPSFSAGRPSGGARVYGYQSRAPGRPHARHFRGRGFVGAPYAYDYGYGYANGCAYEYRRAVATGSPYWWARYQECID